MKPAASRLSSIDALRGLAALSVLLYHARGTVWIGQQKFVETHLSWSWNPDDWLAWITTPFWLGFFGVRLLFAISGYCIHRNQARALAQGRLAFDFKHYALRRFLRIYPTYVAGLIVNGLIIYALLPWMQSLGFYNEGTYVPHGPYVFFMNLLTLQEIVVPSYESVYWTLSIEIHFYLVYPLVLWLTQRYGPRAMLYVSFPASLAYCLSSLWISDPISINTTLLYIHFWDNHGINALLLLTHFLPFWFNWCMGAYVAEMEFGRAPKPALPLILTGSFAAILGLNLFYFGHYYRISGTHQLWMTLAELPLGYTSAAIIAWAISPGAQRWWNTTLGRWLAFIGLFSFSLYAIHVPCLRLIGAFYITGRPPLIIYSFIAAGMAIMFAWLFFQLVEKWTLKAPAWLSRK